MLQARFVRGENTSSNRREMQMNRSRTAVYILSALSATLGFRLLLHRQLAKERHELISDLFFWVEYVHENGPLDSGALERIKFNSIAHGQTSVQPRLRDMVEVVVVGDDDE